MKPLQLYFNCPRCGHLGPMIVPEYKPGLVINSIICHQCGLVVPVRREVGRGIIAVNSLRASYKEPGEERAKAVVYYPKSDFMDVDEYIAHMRRPLFTLEEIQYDFDKLYKDFDGEESAV